MPGVVKVTVNDPVVWRGLAPKSPETSWMAAPPQVQVTVPPAAIVAVRGEKRESRTWTAAARGAEEAGVAVGVGEGGWVGCVGAVGVVGVGVGGMETGVGSGVAVLAGVGDGVADSTDGGVAVAVADGVGDGRAGEGDGVAAADADGCGAGDCGSGSPDPPPQAKVRQAASAAPTQRPGSRNTAASCPLVQITVLPRQAGEHRPNG